MKEKTVQVGIFWAVPDEYDGGWNFYEVKKSYPVSAANALGFIDYPYSHYNKWDDVRSLSETDDCYYYPRGRVLYDVNQNKHRIFADECLGEYALQEIIELFEIENYELCRDEHYVSTFTQKRIKDKATVPTLEYEILRGKDKIGENLIELTYGDTKILVELGKALDSGDKHSELEKTVLKNKYDAVVVSHYHADHAGLIEYKKDCPVYIGCGAYRIIKAMKEYRNAFYVGKNVGYNAKTADTQCLRAYKYRNTVYYGEDIGDNVKTYRNGRPFIVGGIKITPFLCDHSAFDSYMLLFEAGGKSILYTGDFRFHGRKDKEKLLSALPKSVNVLICEGTNIGSEKPCFSERELEDKLAEIMRKTDKPVFILQSGSNIDRLVSVYRAAKRSGRILYEDDYTALIASAAGGSIPRPDVFPDVYAFTPRPLRDKRKDMFFELENKRGLRAIAHSGKFVMIVRSSMCGFMNKLYNSSLYLPGSTLVYSMWSGYKQEKRTAEFLDCVTDMFMNIVDLHTSGHATEEDIELLKQTVNADKYVTVHMDKTAMQNPNLFQIDGDSYEFMCPDEFFRREVYNGLQRKFADITPSLTERVERELSKISEYNLVDYFIAICDAVHYAKCVGIAVGTGRGSIVGSLVAYVLDITEVNPIKYALTAEQFFDGNTKEIAVDFCQERRGEIFDYLVSRYGCDRVAHIVYRTENNTNLRPHPTAIAVSENPIEQLTSLTMTKDGTCVTTCSIEECRELGISVFHIFGWNKLTQIQKTIALVKANKGITINFSDTVCGYDDEKVFDFIASGTTDGVFGLERKETQEFMRNFKPQTLEELVAGGQLLWLQSSANKRTEKFLQNLDICAMPKTKLIALYNKIARETPTVICKPHDISYYGYITYQTAYLKCYYPDEFMQVCNQTSN